MCMDEFPSKQVIETLENSVLDREVVSYLMNQMPHLVTGWRKYLRSIAPERYNDIATIFKEDQRIKNYMEHLGYITRTNCILIVADCTNCSQQRARQMVDESIKCGILKQTNFNKKEKRIRLNEPATV